MFIVTEIAGRFLDAFALEYSETSKVHVGATLNKIEATQKNALFSIPILDRNILLESLETF